MLEKGNNTDLSAIASATAEEVSFSKEGEIERFPLVRRLFLALVIILVAGFSFGIGRLTAPQGGEGIKMEYDPSLSGAQAIGAIRELTPLRVGSESLSNGVVASKNGEKYHYQHCPGAKQISEKNKVIFSTAEAAEASGYSLASNCKPR